MDEQFMRFHRRIRYLEFLVEDLVAYLAFRYDAGLQKTMGTVPSRVQAARELDEDCYDQ